MSKAPLSSTYINPIGGEQPSCDLCLQPPSGFLNRKYLDQDCLIISLELFCYFSQLPRQPTGGICLLLDCVRRRTKDIPAEKTKNAKEKKSKFKTVAKYLPSPARIPLSTGVSWEIGACCAVSRRQTDVTIFHIVMDGNCVAFVRRTRIWFSVFTPSATFVISDEEALQ